MQKYLTNLALIHATHFALKNNIDIAGSHIVKQPRKQVYTLTNTETNKPIITVQFYTSRVPSFIIH